MLIKKSKIPFKQLATVGILPSVLKKAIYRARGYKIGKNVSIGFGTVIVGKNVRIGDNTKFGLITVVRAENIDIGRFVTIGSFSMIDTGTLKVGDDSRINEQVIIGGMKTPSSALTLGKRTTVMEYSYINTTMPISIGNDSGIGGHCLLFTHGSWLNQLEGFPVNFAPITIGEMVWLPWRVFVMPGVTIGDRVVVGANSLISKSVLSNSLVAGSPAKVIKENYPASLRAEEITEYFKSYIKDFIGFLEYNDILVDADFQENLWTVSSQSGKSFVMIFYFNEPAFSGKSPKDSVLVFNVGKTNAKMPTVIPEKCLFLDVSRKQRLGTSDSGEEFARFLSRYGLRFDRLD